jgi:uncharacterized membrane protein YdjX (TVP38/TMEM64 family)
MRGRPLYWATALSLPKRLECPPAKTAPLNDSSFTWPTNRFYVAQGHNIGMYPPFVLYGWRSLQILGGEGFIIRPHGWVSYAGISLWAAGLVAFWAIARVSEGGVGGLLEGWLVRVTTSPSSGLWLFGIYLVRPVLLLPTTILTVCAGYLFGPGWGLVYSFGGTLISASLAYLFPRFLLIKGASVSSGGFLQSLRNRSFETVLCARLVALPGDLVNYSSGVLRLPFVAFVSATAIGGLPSLLTAVLAGASIEGDFRFSGMRLNAWYIAISVVLLLGNLIVAREIRRRRGVSWGKPSADQKKAPKKERV